MSACGAQEKRKKSGTVHGKFKSRSVLAELLCTHRANNYSSFAEATGQRGQLPVGVSVKGQEYSLR